MTSKLKLLFFKGHHQDGEKAHMEWGKKNSLRNKSDLISAQSLWVRPRVTVALPLNKMGRQHLTPLRENTDCVLLSSLMWW